MRSGGIGFLLTSPPLGCAAVIALAAAGGFLGAAVGGLAAVGAGAAVGGWWRIVSGSPSDIHDFRPIDLAAVIVMKACSKLAAGRLTAPFDARQVARVGAYRLGNLQQSLAAILSCFSESSSHG